MRIIKSEVTGWMEYVAYGR